MSATTDDASPLTKVEAIIPRAHNLKRVMSDLGFELKQRQPVRLIIPTEHRGDYEATPQEKDKSMRRKRWGWWSWTQLWKPHAIKSSLPLGAIGYCGIGLSKQNEGFDFAGFFFFDVGGLVSLVRAQRTEHLYIGEDCGTQPKRLLGIVIRAW